MIKWPWQRRRAEEARGGSLQEQAHAWLVLLTSGKASVQDGANFRQWLARSDAHAQAFRQARQLWDTLDPVLRQEDVAAAERVAPGVLLPAHVAAGAAVVPRSWRRRALLGGAVMAGGAWLVVRPPWQLWPAWSMLVADYHTAAGEQREVGLSPDVAVWMNTRTALSVRSRRDDSVELVLPDGEAEFRVAGGTALHVYAGGAHVQADDAVFNVRCDAGHASVSCLSGSVRLALGGDTRVVQAGRQLQYDSRALQEEAPVDVDVVTSWRKGWLTFDGQTMAEVVTEINRYRRGRLVLVNDRLAQTHVQGRFALSQLHEAEILIRDGWGASITRLGGNVVVLS